MSADAAATLPSEVQVILHVLQGVLSVVKVVEAAIPQPARAIVDLVVSAIQAAIDALAPPAAAA